MIGLESRTDRVVVTVDGEPFTEYVFEGHAKPILFPIRGPGGVPMTRSWPLVRNVADEPHDHPHHESLWFMHGSVNGVDFWLHVADKKGRRPHVRQTDIELKADAAVPAIESANLWCKADGDVVLSDTRRIAFWHDASTRGIDYAITLHADHGHVTLGDTKEGTMALRVHHALQLKDLDGSKGAAGSIVTSEGLKNAEAWGKPARWIDYFGTVEGRRVGIAIFDHPANLRHPTHWHARDYGLFAANPFGLHDFTGAAAGAGDFTIPEGDSLALRYRFVFHEGDSEAAGIDRRWRAWSET